MNLFSLYKSDDEHEELWTVMMLTYLNTIYIYQTAYIFPFQTEPGLQQHISFPTWFLKMAPQRWAAFNRKGNILMKNKEQ